MLGRVRSRGGRAKEIELRATGRTSQHMLEQRQSLGLGTFAVDDLP